MVGTWSIERKVPSYNPSELNPDCVYMTLPSYENIIKEAFSVLWLSRSVDTSTVGYEVNFCSPLSNSQELGYFPSPMRAETRKSYWWSPSPINFCHNFISFDAALDNWRDTWVMQFLWTAGVASCFTWFWYPSGGSTLGRVEHGKIISYQNLSLFQYIEVPKIRWSPLSKSISRVTTAKFGLSMPRLIHVWTPRRPPILVCFSQYLPQRKTRHLESIRVAILVYKMSPKHLVPFNRKPFSSHPLKRASVAFEEYPTCSQMNTRRPKLDRSWYLTCQYIFQIVLLWNSAFSRHILSQIKSWVISSLSYAARYSPPSHFRACLKHNQP